MGEKVIIVIGDFHIPNRAKEIPEWEKDKMRKADLVAVTGDLCEERVLEIIKEINSNVKVVKGNIDESGDYPEKEVFNYRGVKFGLIHGKGIYPRGDWDQLLEIAKELGVDVLLNGHTHHWAVYEYEGVIFVNPGSATGAWGGSSDPGPQSIAEIEVEDNSLLVKVYHNGNEIFEKEFKISDQRL